MTEAQHHNHSLQEVSCPGMQNAFSSHIKSFINFISTPLGILFTLYILNVIAWGGMLFLLLCNAAPAMCQPSCDDVNSPRQQWIEIDSQIVVALLDVMAFGLLPVRFRDWYWLMRYRLYQDKESLKSLASTKDSWIRLSNDILLDYPLAETGSSNISLLSLMSTNSVERRYGVYIDTNVSSSSMNTMKNILDYNVADSRGILDDMTPTPTELWKIDFVVWCFVANTFFHAALSGFMWGMNRFDRPSWVAPTFVSLAFSSNIMGSIMTLFETRAVKKGKGSR